MTQLVEFKNHRGEILRGLIDRAKSNHGIVFIHGFERTSIESKFKNIVDVLKGKANLFRFDFSGCGLSDGNFSNIACQKLTQELKKAIVIFKSRCPSIQHIIIVSYSFGCCVALRYVSAPNNIYKCIFLAPAFNQKELLRYWFTISHNANKKIVWKNYSRYFIETLFYREMNKPKRLSKEHYISKQYFLENRDIDYQYLLNNLYLDPKKIIIVHGDSDDKVPIESNDKIPKGVRIIKVRGGDHDLQRMDMVHQYIGKIVSAIKK